MKTHFLSTTPKDVASGQEQDRSRKKNVVRSKRDIKTNLITNDLGELRARLLVLLMYFLEDVKMEYKTQVN